MNLDAGYRASLYKLKEEKGKPFMEELEALCAKYFVCLEVESGHDCCESGVVVVDILTNEVAESWDGSFIPDVPPVQTVTFDHDEHYWTDWYDLDTHRTRKCKVDKCSGHEYEVKGLDY